MGKLVADCAFQYYAEEKMIKDTGLITKGEAEKLWKKYEEHFTEQCKNDKFAEMAIWHDMKFENDYREYLKNVRSEDCVIERGIIYTLEPVF